MSKNTYEQPYTVRTINLKDLLAVILDKWVIILVGLLIGALAGAGIYISKADQPSAVYVTEQDIYNARQALSAEEIEQVDYLFAQYKSLKNYRKLMQNILSDSLFTDNEDAVMGYTLYYIESDIQNISKCYMYLAVGREEMEQIAAILGEENASAEDVYRRVNINGEYLNKSNYQDINVEMLNIDGENTRKDILMVTVTAHNEEQVNEVMEIINEAFSKETESLSGIDSNLQFFEVGRQYSTNLTEYIQEQQSYVISSLNDANNQIGNLEVNYVYYLSSDEQVYFYMMKYYDEQSATSVRNSSLLKFVIIGGALGVLIMLICIILWYVFNGRVKSAVDVASQVQMEIPYVLYRKRKGKHLFGCWSRKLKGADLSETDVKEEVAASDLGIKLAEMNCTEAYIVCDTGNAWNMQVSNELKEKIEESNDGLMIHAGNPMSSKEELKLFTDADAIIFIVQLKVTRNRMIDSWMKLRNRYDKPMAGTVILEEC